MKILIIDNTSTSLSRFRLPLIRDLLSHGHSVAVLVGDDKYIDQIEMLGVECVCISKVQNNAFSPTKDFSYKKAILAFLKKNSFDCVLTFQLKPSIFGCLEAKKAGVKLIFATLEGLGRPFSKKGLIWCFVRKGIFFLLRIAFKNITGLFLLNKESQAILLEHKILLNNKIHLLPGIGVDCVRFSYHELPLKKNILMVSRLLRDKGVLLFCEAAREFHRLYPSSDATFTLNGAEDELTKRDLLPFIASGDIVYSGFVQDMVKSYQDCSCFVLPSTYFEGVPMSILEAMSVGRPIITTQNVGCNQTVINGVNGFFMESMSPLELASLIHRVISSEDKNNTFGLASRRLVEERFCSNVVDKQVIEIIESSLFLRPQL